MKNFAGIVRFGFSEEVTLVKDFKILHEMFAICLGLFGEDIAGYICFYSIVFHIPCDYPLFLVGY